MQLKCSEYFKDALKSTDENVKYRLLSKACKQIAQLLPFQNLWPLLLKQDSIFYYMLILQGDFGQNIKMLLDLIIERLNHLPQFQNQFLYSCQQVFRDNYTQCHRDTIKQLKTFIKLINKTDENKNTALLVIETYKVICSSLEDQELILDVYRNLQSTVLKWPQIYEINPLIFHEIENIIGNQRKQSFEIEFIEELTELDSPTKSIKSFRKENQVVVELQRWLAKQLNEIPIISKRIANSVINSQSLFKINDNVEIFLSFVYCPLKYDPTNVWGRLDHPFKISLKEMPNFVEALDLQYPAQHYHMRSIRTIQCLTDDENHSTIAKINPNYLSVAFSYFNECFIEDGCKYMNFNHFTQLIMYFIDKEYEISVYYLLFYNIPHALALNLQYDQLSTLLTRLLLDVNPFSLKKYNNYQEEVWRYLFASQFFQDLAEYILNQQNAELIISKASPNFRNHEMMEAFAIQPDFTLSEHPVQNNYENVNFVIEERFHMAQDIDGLRPYILKRSVKTFKFFNKLTEQLIAQTIIKNDDNLIRHAINQAQEEENIQAPVKKRISRKSLNQDRLLVLRSASLFSFKEEEIKFESQNSKQDVTKMSEHKSDSHHTKRSLLERKSSLFQNLNSQPRFQNKKTKSNSFLYPQSLKDVTNTKLDIESKQEFYLVENLIKKEQLSYNGIELLSVLIQYTINNDMKMIKNHLYHSMSNYTTMILGNDKGIFETIFKVYIFKIKLTPHIKENSGYLAGKLVNLILKQRPQYCNLNENCKLYLDAICKLIIQSMNWSNVEINTSKIMLVETLTLLVQTQIGRGTFSILNQLNTQTWSCLIEMLRISTIIRQNQVYQQQFQRLLKLTLEFGSDFNYYTIFMKLGLLNTIQQISNQLQVNQVINPQYKHLQIFLTSIIQLIQNNLTKSKQSTCSTQVNSLQTWQQLRNQYHVQSSSHAYNSFYTVSNQTIGRSSTPATNQSNIRIRIHKPSVTRG